MSAPSDDTNHCSSRLKFRFASAKVIPATERNSASIFNSSPIFCSTETVNQAAGGFEVEVLHPNGPDAIANELNASARCPLIDEFGMMRDDEDLSQIGRAHV